MKDELREVVRALRDGDWNMRTPQELADMLASMIERWHGYGKYASASDDADEAFYTCAEELGEALTTRNDTMTNPDNAGGLDDHKPVPLSEELRIEAAMISGDVYVRGDSFVARMTRMAEQAERLEELCRAAPAGGDEQRLKAAKFDLHTTFAKLKGYASLNEALIAAPDPVSAPAGSGEVSIDAEWLELVANRWDKSQKISPMECDRLLSIAALLRKLQQGADGELDALRLIRDQWLEENGPGGWIDELRNAVERANALADRWDHIYGRFADELRGALEGGNADH